MGLWLAMACVVVLALWQLRREALNSQGRELSLLALAATDAIGRGLGGIEEGLHALRDELGEPDGGLNLADASTRQSSLRTRAGLMPLVESLWLLSESGQLIAGSNKLPAPELTSFFPGLESAPRDGLSLSRAYPESNASAPGTKEMVALAMHFAGPRQGQAKGWIVAAFPSTALFGAFGAALPATDARMIVLRRDGARLAAVNVQETPAPGLADARNTSLATMPGLALRRFPDGSDNLVAFHSVPRFGVQVVVTRDLAAGLSTWRHVAELSAVTLALLLLVMAAAVYFVQLADRRRAEAHAALRAQVSRAGKLESLGTLAGGVAHDFNNVLAGIVGYGEMARDAAPPGSMQARQLDRLMQAAWRGRSLVERILAFSRGGAKTSTIFELEPVVEEVLTLLATSLRSGIVLQRELEAPGACLKGDPTQAFEAVMNLCTNAMQAMPGGGVLSVHLARVAITEPRILSHTRLAPGKYITLAVADQGSGITPEVMDHLFEPFFTTKAAQSGTGLGLAVVFGVVAEFGGAIHVQSGAGQGARFTLYLPECGERAAAADAELPPAAEGAGQRVMVVDDEPELVALTTEMLQGLGYAPEGYTDSAAALKAMQDDPTAYAALITDEVMPALTGTLLAQAVRRVAPRLPVLLVSGYGGALLAQRADAAGVTRVLTKPVQRASLARALAETLRSV